MEHWNDTIACFLMMAAKARSLASRSCAVNFANGPSRRAACRILKELIDGSPTRAERHSSEKADQDSALASQPAKTKKRPCPLPPLSSMYA